MADGVDASERYLYPDLTDGTWHATDYYTNASNGQKDFSFYFKVGDIQYVDFSYQQLAGYKLEDVVSKSFEGAVRLSAPIYGNWTLSVPLETLPEQTMTMSESMGLTHMTIKKMIFTVLGVQVEGVTVYL